MTTSAIAAAASIRQAIWLYVRFTLSFLHLEDLLAERCILVSYETVRRWVNHFGPKIAADLCKHRPTPHMTWHLDEVFVKIEGRMVHLWRGVDGEVEVLTLASPTAVAAVDGATIERRIRINRPADGRGRRKGSRALDPRRDLMQRSITSSTSGATLPQQERVGAFRASAMRP
jgi:hypothetical protein